MVHEVGTVKILFSLRELSWISLNICYTWTTGFIVSHYDPHKNSVWYLFYRYIWNPYYLYRKCALVKEFWADLQFTHQFTYSPYFWGILRYWFAWRKNKNWLTMTFPCEELAISLEMAKWVGIDQEDQGGVWQLVITSGQTVPGSVTCSVIDMVYVCISEVVVMR